MASQAIFELETGPVSVMVVALEAGRDLAVYVMAVGTGQLGEML